MSSLFVVSTGPGDTALLAPRAQQLIAASSDLVAYGFYLDLLPELCSGKQHHDLPLGQEIERARLALNLASSGKTTSLISSGDIGIYAMATLVFELLDRQLQGLEDHPEWLDVNIEVVPGVSAMQAAASRVGAFVLFRCLICLLPGKLNGLIERYNIYRVKGFIAMPGKPMRQVLQGVGERLETHFDRLWEADEPRQTKLVFIGKGFHKADLDAALQGVVV